MASSQWGTLIRYSMDFPRRNFFDLEGDDDRFLTYRSCEFPYDRGGLVGKPLEYREGIGLAGTFPISYFMSWYFIS